MSVAADENAAVQRKFGSSHKEASWRSHSRSRTCSRTRSGSALNGTNGSASKDLARWRLTSARTTAAASGQSASSCTAHFLGGEALRRALPAGGAHGHVIDSCRRCRGVVCPWGREPPRAPGVADVVPGCGMGSAAGNVVRHAQLDGDVTQDDPPGHHA